jgi:pimeloyl-ACP methyl ester carboxylesterase
MTEEQQRTAFDNAERDCSSEYYETATKPIRVEDGIIAVRALRQQPWVRSVILAGHSEGTEVVTGLLQQFNDAEISVAGLFASAGPIRFFCGYAARGPGNRELYNQAFNRIRTLQGTNDALMWNGLPARRWKTFWLGSTPIDDVRDSTVPLFVAQGERDDTTLCADLFALEAIRQQPARPIRYVVVERGNHAFETPDGQRRAADLFQDFLAWALNPNRETSLASLK